jgi:hypothetical protein
MAGRYCGRAPRRVRYSTIHPEELSSREVALSILGSVPGMTLIPPSVRHPRVEPTGWTMPSPPGVGRGSIREVKTVRKRLAIEDCTHLPSPSLATARARGEQVKVGSVRPKYPWEDCNPPLAALMRVPEPPEDVKREIIANNQGFFFRPVASAEVSLSVKNKTVTVPDPVKRKEKLKSVSVKQENLIDLNCLIPSPVHSFVDVMETGSPVQDSSSSSSGSQSTIVAQGWSAPVSPDGEVGDPVEGEDGGEDVSDGEDGPGGGWKDTEESRIREIAADVRREVCIAEKRKEIRMLAFLKQPIAASEGIGRYPFGTDLRDPMASIWVDGHGLARVETGAVFAAPRLDGYDIKSVTVLRDGESEEVRVALGRLGVPKTPPHCASRGTWSYRRVLSQPLRAHCASVYEACDDDALMQMMCRSHAEYVRLRASKEGKASCGVMELSLHKLLFSTICMFLDELRTCGDVGHVVWDGWWALLSHWVATHSEFCDGVRLCLEEHGRLVQILMEVVRRVYRTGAVYTEVCAAVLQRCTRFTRNEGALYGLCWFPKCWFKKTVGHSFTAGEALVRVGPDRAAVGGDDIFPVVRAEYIRHLYLHFPRGHDSADSQGDILGLSWHGLCRGPGKSH